jgi:uncharacterized beta-barrel protein YwiB (DUF1934 family)
MKVKVTLTQFNLIDNEEKVIADGNAILNKNELKYKEDKSSALHFVTFEEDVVKLERKSDVSSITVLNNGKWGHSTVKSPYGDMELKTKTHKISKKFQEWSVEYSIYSQNEEVLRQKLVWNIQYLS